MMTEYELFDAWAPEPPPEGPRWTDWAKPVLFAHVLHASVEAPAPDSSWVPAPGAGEPVELPAPDVAWAPAPEKKCAIVVDVRGAASALVGAALAQRGYRVVPLYNGTPNPVLSRPAVDAKPILRALMSHASEVRAASVATDAPPAFLLDGARGGTGAPGPGVFDNRWVVLPQDFPSANYILSQEIREAIVASDSGSGVRADLAHVLLRWQKAGVAVRVFDATTGEVRDVTIPRPWNFGAVWYAALAIMGLRRNSAGGFGSIVPMPGESGGWG